MEPSQVFYISLQKIYKYFPPPKRHFQKDAKRAIPQVQESIFLPGQIKEANVVYLQKDDSFIQYFKKFIQKGITKRQITE